MFNLPVHDPVPDYTLYIDAASGRKLSFYDFRDFVRDGATALGAPQALGGLQINAQTGDVVGILGHNCIVSISHQLPATPS